MLNLGNSAPELKRSVPEDLTKLLHEVLVVGELAVPRVDVFLQQPLV